ncbi:FAD-dependent oxidoreductase [Siccirubricoccus deserti]|uniref:FAD-dependent monooxygenase n=1 Tax=Siccirubricoccus deserti TaxID=2013562 RepID=A0A9X0QZ59_9PROT|nr:FAD-dependent monooxygenase [Siccirubricoccus deserti]MBC4016666.1 FAD-dependent monooxygenase [Siccirubricoccus deserti]GGC50933.1 FAD-dependent oxidoreductase [Siccirubricoccus deserti]
MYPEARYDVLVVGARCAGAATAMLMARHGLRVMVIDRAAHGSDTISTHALMRGGVLQLHRWGLLPRLRARATPAVRSTTFHYGMEPITVAIRAQDGVDALYAPRRTVLDGMLADAAAEAGAEVRHGHSLAALIRRDRGDRITGAVVVDPQGRPRHVEAALVVGADGIGSRVARLVEAPVQRESRAATAAVYGHWSGLSAEGYHWHYAPGASVGVIPTNAGQHCVFASVPPERFLAGFRADAMAAYRGLLRGLAPALAAEVAVGRLESRLWAFAGRRGFFRQAHGPGWALVGDAGYFKDPLTAHGITDALRDAELLAEAAAAGTERAMAHYAAARDALSLPLFEATDAIAAFDWDLEALKAHHQALNRAMKLEVEFLAARAAAPMAESV